MPLHIVTGPPASGKTTWVREHARPGDIRIDYDALANTLAGLEEGHHDHTHEVKRVARAARTAAIEQAVRVSQRVPVWIIHSSPSPRTLARYRRAGGLVHVVDPGRDIVLERCRRERPPHMLAVARRWYEDADQTSGPRPAIVTASTPSRAW